LVPFASATGLNPQYQQLSASARSAVVWQFGQRFMVVLP
jgi:hypothetical protein